MSKHQCQIIEGKVRDCIILGDKRIILASDRLSAFDVVLTTIPFKGQLLTEMANFWFEKTRHIIPNHIISNPHPNVVVCQEVRILPVEIIVRGYLAGSAWRDYEAGRAVSGIALPTGMRKSQKLHEPLLTPSTKAERGKHDEPISCAEIVSQGLVRADIWDAVSKKAVELFNYGSAEAAKNNLILVDTKYEFGILTDSSGKETLVLADEIHTQDSSRYWVLSSYAERFERGEDPEMLDKEFVRRELISQGYMGNGTPPQLSDDFRVDTSIKYIEAYEQITGKVFTPNRDTQGELIAVLEKVLRS